MELRVGLMERPVFRPAVLFAVLACFAWFATPSLPSLDDAYIPLDSAISLRDGSDAQYGSAPLTGVTSPPYVAALRFLLALNLPPLTAARSLAASGLVALVVALWLLATAVGLVDWRRWLFLVALLSSGPLMQQSANWLETGWAIAMAIVLIAAGLANRPYAAAGAAGLLPWLRPDLSVLAATFLVWTLSRSVPAMRWRALVVASAVFVPWPLWLHAETGHWLPQTMEAKALFFAESCRPFFSKLSLAAQGVWRWLPALAPASLLGFLWIGRATPGRLILLATGVALAFYVAVLPGGLWHNSHRYIYPLAVPPIALGMARFLVRPGRVPSGVAMAIVIANVALWPMRKLPDEAAERVEAAAWIRGHVDPSARLVVHDAGTFAVFTTNPLTDMVGLKTPASIEAHRRLTAPSCGADRMKAVADIARSSGARYLVVTGEWDQIFGVTDGLRREGLVLQGLRRAPAPYGYYVYSIVASRPRG